MILNHINLSVSDVGAAKAFPMTYFGLRDTGWGGGNRNMAFLRDDGGFLLSMFTHKDTVYPGTFHIGFGQPDRAAVLAMNERLKADGLRGRAAEGAPRLHLLRGRAPAASKWRSCAPRRLAAGSCPRSAP
jgi:hypothetical protein